MSQQTGNVLSYSTRGVANYVPSDGRARIAQAALIVSTAFCFVGMAYHAWDYSLIRRLERGADPRAVVTDTYNLITLLVGVVEIGLVIVAGVLLLMWLHRAYTNLLALGHTPRFTPGWAVGYWFIPIVNLWRPYQVMKDWWLRSEGDTMVPGYERVTAPSVLSAWWACWICSGFVARFAGSMATGAQPGEFLTFYTAALMMIAAEVLAVIAGVMLLKVISSIVNAQRVAYASVSAAPVAPVYAEPLPPSV